MTPLSDLQDLIVTTRAERGFTTDPARLVCLLVEEVGEVAAEIKKTWSPNYPDLVVGELANEIADAFVLLTALASAFEIDIAEAVQSKFVVDDSGRPWATADAKQTQGDHA